MNHVISIVLIIFTQKELTLLFSLFLGVNRALLTYIQGFFAYCLVGGGKGFILSCFISFRSVAVGLAALPGVFLYHIDPSAPFYTEGILTILWAGISFHGYIRNFWGNRSLHV